MAWQTPKTDWVAGDGTTDTDYNRIEGNILELYNNTATVETRVSTVEEFIDAMSATAFTVLTSDWEYPYTVTVNGIVTNYWAAQIDIPGLVATDRIDLFFDPDSSATAIVAEMIPSTEIYQNTANTGLVIWIFAKTQPAVDLSGTYSKFKEG